LFFYISLWVATHGLSGDIVTLSCSPHNDFLPLWP
jgi:hypothetical protein